MTIVSSNFTRTGSTRAYSKLHLRWIPFHMAIGTVSFFPLGFSFPIWDFLLSSLFSFHSRQKPVASWLPRSPTPSPKYSTLILHLSVVSLHCRPVSVSKFAGFLGKVKEKKLCSGCSHEPIFCPVLKQPNSSTGLTGSILSWAV